MGKRIYISGKITGTKDCEEKFRRATECVERVMFRGEVSYVVNPVRLSMCCDEACRFPYGTMPKEVYMRKDIALLVTCDTIVMLPDWQESEGAKLEYEVAKAIGITIVHADWTADTPS